MNKTGVDPTERDPSRTCAMNTRKGLLCWH